MRHNIELVANAIGALPGVGFNMGAYICRATEVIADKTGLNRPFVACVAGTAFLLATGLAPEEALSEDIFTVEREAARYMGLTKDQAFNLFFDLPDGIDLEDVTPDMAKRSLYHLAQTGEVRWRFE